MRDGNINVRKLSCVVWKYAEATQVQAAGTPQILVLRWYEYEMIWILCEMGCHTDDHNCVIGDTAPPLSKRGAWESRVSFLAWFQTCNLSPFDSSYLQIVCPWAAPVMRHYSLQQEAHVGRHRWTWNSCCFWVQSSFCNDFKAPKLFVLSVLSSILSILLYIIAISPWRSQACFVLQVLWGR